MSVITEVAILLAAVREIAAYSDPEAIRETAEERYGLEPQEAIEMAYENVLSTARAALRSLGSDEPAL